MIAGRDRWTGDAVERSGGQGDCRWARVLLPKFTSSPGVEGLNISKLSAVDYFFYPSVDAPILAQVSVPVFPLLSPLLGTISGLICPQLCIKL